MKVNDDQGICYPQPHTLPERLAIARDFLKRFHYPIPLLVDDAENHANALYAAWPERFYIIDENGKIAYKGKTGPFGYHPDEVEDWLARRFPTPVVAPVSNAGAS